MRPFETALKDGTMIRVRPVVPGDRALIADGFDHLSDRSRFFRFLAPLKVLRPETLADILAPSNPDHCVIGALDLGMVPPEPAGLARYERLPTEPEIAELAVTVVDAYQGKGLGTLLVGCLAHEAVQAGIREFFALVHGENLAMARLMRAIGGTSAIVGDGTLEFAIPLHADPAFYPRTPAGDRLRTAYALLDRG